MGKRERALAPWRLQALMAVAVLGVAGVAAWDESREAEAAFRDLAAEQAVLASSVADDVTSHLESGSVEDPAALAGALAGARRLERAGELTILLAPSGATRLRGLDGRSVELPSILEALARGSASISLGRPEAARAGLEPRTALVGLARAEDGAHHPLGIAVVASAARERDREMRARWRLLVTVAMAAGLVLLFGGIALREQRKELELARDLGMAELSRDRDERLKRLERAATMLTLASGFAHELSTPLGVIMGRAEQVEARAGNDERLSRSARAILEQSERIGEVVKGFLLLARGGSPRLEQVLPSDVATGARQLVEHRFEAAGATLSITQLALPAISGEPRLLEQAVVNLLVNSCEACGEGGHVSLSVSREGEFVRFSVVDDGPGISDQAAARATEPFFTTKETGTGLGLAIVSEIARLHHGRFEIGPAPDRGTRAILDLPIDRGSA